jgi:hypothetical protein
MEMVPIIWKIAETVEELSKRPTVWKMIFARIMEMLAPMTTKKLI